MFRVVPINHKYSSSPKKKNTKKKTKKKLKKK